MATGMSAPQELEAYGSEDNKISNPLYIDWSLTMKCLAKLSLNRTPQGRLTNSDMEMEEVLL